MAYGGGNLIKIGDYLEIIDTTGCDYGRKGDKLVASEIKERGYGSSEQIVAGTILTGDHKGQESSRFWYRYKIITAEWDI